VLIHALLVICLVLYRISINLSTFLL